jgi:Large ribosomal RNA subunit accumulation protein YceD
MDRSENPWTVPIAVDEISETGQHVQIEAPPAVRAAIAKLAGLRELPRLSAEFDLARRGAGARVTGQVSATVGQTCVVTLEPIENEIVESIDVAFAPQHEAAAAGDARVQVKQAKSGQEPPEPLIGDTFDLGALATEFLLLGIDPYPRKAGAKFASPQAETTATNPFAALEALKKRSGNERP